MHPPSDQCAPDSDEGEGFNDSRSFAAPPHEGMSDDLTNPPPPPPPFLGGSSSFDAFWSFADAIYHTNPLPSGPPLFHREGDLVGAVGVSDRQPVADAPATLYPSEVHSVPYRHQFPNTSSARSPVSASFQRYHVPSPQNSHSASSAATFDPSEQPGTRSKRTREDEKESDPQGDVRAPQSRRHTATATPTSRPSNSAGTSTATRQEAWPTVQRGIISGSRGAQPMYGQHDAGMPLGISAIAPVWTPQQPSNRQWGVSAAATASRNGTMHGTTSSTFRDPGHTPGLPHFPFLRDTTSSAQGMALAAPELHRQPYPSSFSTYQPIPTMPWTTSSSHLAYGAHCAQPLSEAFTAPAHIAAPAFSPVPRRAVNAAPWAYTGVDTSRTAPRIRQACIVRLDRNAPYSLRLSPSHDGQRSRPQAHSSPRVALPSSSIADDTHASEEVSPSDERSSVRRDRKGKAKDTSNADPKPKGKSTGKRSKKTRTGSSQTTCCPCPYPSCSELYPSGNSVKPTHDFKRHVDSHVIKLRVTDEKAKPPYKARPRRKARALNRIRKDLCLRRLKKRFGTLQFEEMRDERKIEFGGKKNRAATDALCKPFTFFWLPCKNSEPYKEMARDIERYLRWEEYRSRDGTYGWEGVERSLGRYATLRRDCACCPEPGDRASGQLPGGSTAASSSAAGPSRSNRSQKRRSPRKKNTAPQDESGDKLDPESGDDGNEQVEQAAMTARAPEPAAAGQATSGPSSHIGDSGSLRTERSHPQIPHSLQRDSSVTAPVFAYCATYEDIFGGDDTGSETDHARTSDLTDKDAEGETDVDDGQEDDHAVVAPQAIPVAPLATASTTAPSLSGRNQIAQSTTGMNGGIAPLPVMDATPPFTGGVAATVTDCPVLAALAESSAQAGISRLASGSVGPEQQPVAGSGHPSPSSTAELSTSDQCYDPFFAFLKPTGLNDTD
ncbi:hypothetical protein C8Q77DRAFT_1157529 [Trametes polyzona]|nr:hypothetical protein C8Q77DRAFT_1157529 [Trametes polyzona]